MSKTSASWIKCLTGSPIEHYNSIDFRLEHHRNIERMNVLPLKGWNMLQIWNYLANTVQRGRYMFIDIIII